MDHQARAISEYLDRTLGVRVVPRPWPGSSRLAPFLAESYHFFHAAILHQPVLFMVDAQPSAESPGVIRKHVGLVREKSERLIVYVREHVTASTRTRLIEQRVPFIVPGNQMYLPDLGIDLREHFHRHAAPRLVFRPATQAVFIHALLRPAQTPLTTSDLVPLLGYSAMTMSRAFDELERSELADSTTAGRERWLRLRGVRRDAWERAQPFLTDPVKSRHFVRALPAGEIPPLAGLSALASCSMLADPEHRTFAMSREAWKEAIERGTMIALDEGDQSDFEIETWTYAPAPFRGRSIVDPLSLFLSLRRAADERITQAMGRMLEELPW
jgi:hypothetical protein